VAFVQYLPTLHGLVVFVYYQPALRDSPDLWKIKGLVDFLCSYRIADFVQR
jgi:hypothetical protein